MKRFLFPLFVCSWLFVAAPADAQTTLGTFRWNLAPFCNVLNLTVTQQGNAFSLTGFEEQCGGNPSLPVFGTAILQADGAIWIGVTTIGPLGRTVHTQATLNATISGTWEDSAISEGTFVFSPTSVSGGPRPIVLPLDRVGVAGRQGTASLPGEISKR